MPRAEARKQKAHRLSESRQVSECPGMEMVLHCANLSMFNQKLGPSPAGSLRKLLPPVLRHGMRVKVVGSHCSSQIGQQSPQKWWVLRVVMVPGTVLGDKLGNGVFRRHLLMACGNGASSDVCDEVEGTRKQRRGRQSRTWILQRCVSLSNERFFIVPTLCKRRFTF